MKTALIGGLNVDSTTAFSPFKSIGVIDLFHYREEDIFVMTDEEKNVGTEHWPSKENIVSDYFFFSRGARLPCSWLHIHSHWKNNQIQLRAIDNLVGGATPGDAFVFYCELLSFCATLSSSVHHLISIDAGHGGRNDVVGGNRTCECKYNFSRWLVFWPSN
jgi:hypothetical protein